MLIAWLVLRFEQYIGHTNIHKYLVYYQNVKVWSFIGYVQYVNLYVIMSNHINNIWQLQAENINLCRKLIKHFRIQMSIYSMCPSGPKLKEALWCSGPWHSCRCYFDKLHLTKHFCRPSKPLHGNCHSFIQQDNLYCHIIKIVQDWFEEQDKGAELVYKFPISS